MRSKAFLQILLFAIFGVNAERFDALIQCKVLFVADLSDNAPTSQIQTIVATMNTLFHNSAPNGVNASVAHWRYSRGGDIDGPIPTKFVYSFQDSDLNFGSPGGSLDIVYATSALSKWVIQDAVIVLFTGSDPSKFAAAGEHYNRRWSTVGVTVGADASPFAILSIPYMQPLAIFQAVIELCRQQYQSTTSSAPTTEFGTYTVTQSSSILTTATSTPPTATSTSQLTSSEPDPGQNFSGIAFEGKT